MFRSSQFLTAFFSLRSFTFSNFYLDFYFPFIFGIFIFPFLFGFSFNRVHILDFFQIFSTISYIGTILCSRRAPANKGSYANPLSMINVTTSYEYEASYNSCCVPGPVNDWSIPKEPNQLCD